MIAPDFVKNALEIMNSPKEKSQNNFYLELVSFSELSSEEEKVAKYNQILEQFKSGELFTDEKLDEKSANQYLIPFITWAHKKYGYPSILENKKELNPKFSFDVIKKEINKKSNTYMNYSMYFDSFKDLYEDLLIKNNVNNIFNHEFITKDYFIDFLITNQRYDKENNNALKLFFDYFSSKDNSFNNTNKANSSSNFLYHFLKEFPDFKKNAKNQIERIEKILFETIQKQVLSYKEESCELLKKEHYATYYYNDLNSFKTFIEKTFSNLSPYSFELKKNFNWLKKEEFLDYLDDFQFKKWANFIGINTPNYNIKKDFILNTKYKEKDFLNMYSKIIKDFLIKLEVEQDGFYYTKPQEVKKIFNLILTDEKICKKEKLDFYFSFMNDQSLFAKIDEKNKTKNLNNIKISLNNTLKDIEGLLFEHLDLVEELQSNPDWIAKILKSKAFTETYIRNVDFIKEINFHVDSFKEIPIQMNGKTYTNIYAYLNEIKSFSLALVCFSSLETESEKIKQYNSIVDRFQNDEFIADERLDQTITNRFLIPFLNWAKKEYGDKKILEDFILDFKISKHPNSFIDERILDDRTITILEPSGKIEKNKFDNFNKFFVEFLKTKPNIHWDLNKEPHPVARFLNNNYLRSTESFNYEYLKKALKYQNIFVDLLDPKKDFKGHLSTDDAGNTLSLKQHLKSLNKYPLHKSESVEFENLLYYRSEIEYLKEEKKWIS